MSARAEKKGKQRLVNLLFYILMSVIAVVMVIPFVWMLSTSFKENGKVLIFPPQWIPKPWIWENYSYAWTAANMAQYRLDHPGTDDYLFSGCLRIFKA